MFRTCSSCSVRSSQSSETAQIVSGSVMGECGIIALAESELEPQDSEDSDEESTFISLIAAESVICRERAKVCGYVETVIPHYIDSIFKRLFRMSRHVFDVLVGYLKDLPEMQHDWTGGLEPISVEKMLYVTLWYVGSVETINKIADRFGIGEASVLECRRKVINCILKYLKPRFLKWPTDEEKQQESRIFSERNGFPNIIGALDGTHVRISKPRYHPQRYINRKNYYSIQLQAVCGHNMSFSHVFVGYPGSCHDSRILKQSDLWDEGMQLCGLNYHILADAAYPLRQWLLTPFRDNGHLSDEQKKYNAYHSANRVVIERAFGLLKGRFCRLQNLNTKYINTAVDVIMCCCVLHNICILNCDDVEQYMQFDVNIDDIPQANAALVEHEAAGQRKRNTISINLI